MSRDPRLWGILLLSHSSPVRAERNSRTESALLWDRICPTIFDFLALSLSLRSLYFSVRAFYSALTAVAPTQSVAPRCDGAGVKDGVSPSRTVYGEGNGVGGRERFGLPGEGVPNLTVSFGVIDKFSMLLLSDLGGGK